MPTSLVYRTTDGTRWGGGQGSDLSATTIDINFFTLFSAIQALEDHAEVGAGIDFITQPTNGNIFFVHLTDHRVLGPFTIPTAQWNPRGDWVPSTSYALFDTVGNNGSLYLVITPHTSSAISFSPFATDGLGHELYALILEQPANELPLGGTPGQRLVKSTGSPFTSEWLDDHIRLNLFVEGQPDPSEMLMQYNVVDHMTLPSGLGGSVIFQGIPSATNVTYTLLQNSNPIGTITFTGPSPIGISVAFSAAVHFVPGDVLQLEGPATPDASQSNISFTFVATLTL